MIGLAHKSLGLAVSLFIVIVGACGGDETTTMSTPNGDSTLPSSGSSTPTTSAGNSASGTPSTGKATTTTTTKATTTTTPMATAGTSAAASGTMSSAPSPTGASQAAQVPSQTASAGSAASAVTAAAGTGAQGTDAAAAGSGAAAPMMEGTPTLFWLEFNTSSVMKSQDMKTKTKVASTGVAPDGVGVDVAGGKLYWTNMGSPLGTGGGTVQRANLDGGMVETIVPAGVGTTFKQMTLDLTNQKIYWGDREGKKLWRANLDGSMHEAIVSGHGISEVVGVAVDVAGGKVYFTDRTGGKILRANIEMPAGATGDSRMDVEDVLVAPPGSTPIDLDIDHNAKKLYWTDRALGTVHVMELEMPAGMSAADRTDDKTIINGLSEPIGICLDVPNNKMYYTELGGSISVAALDGSGKQPGILRGSGATGCALVYLPD